MTEKLAAQANFCAAKLSGSGRSHKREAEKDRDWKREQQPLLRHTR